MKKRIYSLLVGIDEYKSPVKALKGCVNDITRFDTFMENSMAQGHDYYSKSLQNEQATKAQVIDHFLNHLGQANENDTALFYYAGHGDQELCPPELRHVENNRYNQKLICYDSMDEGIYGLSDKELGQMIAKVAESGCHVVIILDSCHSGSGTRDISEKGVRNYPTPEQNRPLESYLLEGMEHKSYSVSTENGQKSKWIIMPQGNHILLAACESNQTAKEDEFNAEASGIFSHFLLETLTQLGPTASYREIIRHVSANTHRKQFNQTPLAEVTNSTLLQQPFLGGAVSSSASYLTIYPDERRQWCIDKGAIHGLSQQDEGHTQLAIYQHDATLEQMRDPSTAKGTGTIKKVDAAKSFIDILVDGVKPHIRHKFKGLLLNQSFALHVSIAGTDESINVLLEQIQTHDLGRALLKYVTNDQADYHVTIDSEKKQTTIYPQGMTKSACMPVNGDAENSALEIIDRLCRIAKWEQVSRLTNNQSELAKHIKLELIFNDEVVGEKDQNRYVLVDGKKIKSPSFKLQLTHSSGETLHAGVVNLTDTYGLFPEKIGRLDKKDALAVYPEDDFIKPWVQDSLVKQGITQTTDVLKFIVSTKPFDIEALFQENIDKTMGRKRGEDEGPVTRTTRSSLEDVLFTGSQTRQAIGRSDNYRLADWATLDVQFTTVEKDKFESIQNDRFKLGHEVRLMAHPSLNEAKARLISEDNMSRDSTRDLVAPVVQQLSESVRPYPRNTIRGDFVAQPSVIEIKNISSPSDVRADNPVRIALSGQLNDNEHVLAFAVDGDFILPIGFGKNTDSGIDVLISKFPEPEATRSLTSSIRIMFRKIVSDKVGIDSPYPRLAIAEQNTTNKDVRYITNKDKIKNQIESTENILLYIHGIIGDSKQMIRSSSDFRAHNELLLTFDYDCINTNIEQSARDLKECLVEIGLDENHKKIVTIVAHSVGGLVARWFVERAQGDQIVQRLIMLGTPNDGTPWPKLQDFATGMLGLALNGLGGGWPLSVLGAAIGGIESVDKTLDQMQKNSELLISLTESDPNNVEYFSVAGNTQNLIDSDKVQSLFEKLFSDQTLHKIGDHLFADKPNDLAVSVESVNSFPKGFDVTEEVVACNHMSYFQDRVTLNLIKNILINKS